MKKLLLLMILSMCSVVIYIISTNNQSHQSKGEVSQEKMVKSKNVPKEHYITKEEVLNTLESKQTVSNEATNKLESAIKDALNYLKTVDYPSNLKREELSMFQLTADDALYELYSSAITHYQFENLEVYQSDSDNVYQFLLVLRMSEEEKEELEKNITSNEEYMYYTGNFVPNTGQIELVKMHGEIQYTHDHGHD
ncbi:hypothetical protein [Streptococcus pluranimalium]|uniref:hypothetical protein n=1 Tax=Streptococcus pluranimalium TaxID=82348 RepID=UPI003F68CFA5